MNDDIKFTTYNQWEKYIQSKYKSLNKLEFENHKIMSDYCSP